jgi:hypothetical protein
MRSSAVSCRFDRLAIEKDMRRDGGRSIRSGRIKFEAEIASVWDEGETRLLMILGKRGRDMAELPSMTGMAEGRDNEWTKARKSLARGEREREREREREKVVVVVVVVVTGFSGGAVSLRPIHRSATGGRRDNQVSPRREVVESSEAGETTSRENGLNAARLPSCFGRLENKRRASQE